MNEQEQLALPFDNPERLQWPAALGAGLIAGGVLLLAPGGSPWSGLTFFSHVIMGRALPPGISMTLPEVCVVHLLIAEVYALIIAGFLQGIRQGRAIVVGGINGIFLYLLNFGLVSALWPHWRGNEPLVLFRHIVFGLVAGGASSPQLNGASLRRPLPSNGFSKYALSLS